MKTTFAVGALCACVWAWTALGAEKENVCVVGGHPDDLVGSAGLCCLLDDAGFKIHVIDFTRGELGLGMPGLLDGTTARTRMAEETNACAVIHATPHFIDEVDGFAYASSNAVAQMSALFRELKPRAVIAHWPVDTHMDHVMSYAAMMKALVLARQDPEIYFFEETTQSMGFVPVHYVDITPVLERKNRLIRCYVCQNGPDWIVNNKLADSTYRGSRMRPAVPHGEAFGAYTGPADRARTIFSDLAAFRERQKKGASR